MASSWSTFLVLSNSAKVSYEIWANASLFEAKIGNFLGLLKESTKPVVFTDAMRRAGFGSSIEGCAIVGKLRLLSTWALSDW